jgi:hypothetical protein
MYSFTDTVRVIVLKKKRVLMSGKERRRRNTMMSTGRISELTLLPIEIILETRRFLYLEIPLCTPDNPFGYASDDFIAAENRWSWRNFLSVSNTKEWKWIRKHAMIWTLTRTASWTCFKKEKFRNSVARRVSETNQKLTLHLEQFQTYCLSNQMEFVLDTSLVGSITVSDYNFPDSHPAKPFKHFEYIIPWNLKD